MKQEGDVDVERITDALLQYILDHLPDFLEGQDIKDLVVLAEAEVPVLGPPRTVTTTRASAMDFLAQQVAGTNAIACANAIRAKTAENEVPCLFVVHTPRGTFIQTASAHYVPGGLTATGGVS